MKIYMRGFGVCVFKYTHTHTHIYVYIHTHTYIIYICMPTYDFPGGSDGKESACNAGNPGSIPGSGRFPGEGNGNPLQYSCLENFMGRGAWWTTVHGVSKSRTQLSDWHFYFHVYTHSHVYMYTFQKMKVNKIHLWAHSDKGLDNICPLRDEPRGHGLWTRSGLMFSNCDPYSKLHPSF